MERDGDFVLLETGKKVRITYSEKENSAVKCAVSKLAEDIRKVCDCNVELGSSFGNSVSENETEIIIITMDTPCSLQNIPEEMLPALERIMDGQGKGRWEAYLHQIYGSSFYIVGADRRGTVFGIYANSWGFPRGISGLMFRSEKRNGLFFQRITAKRTGLMCLTEEFS